MIYVGVTRAPMNIPVSPWQVVTQEVSDAVASLPALLSRALAAGETNLGKLPKP